MLPSVRAVQPCALIKLLLYLAMPLSPTNKKGLHHRFLFILATDAQRTGRWDVTMFPGPAQCCMPAGRIRCGWADQMVSTSTGALGWASSTTQQRQITERKFWDQLVPAVRPYSAAPSSWKPQLTSQNRRASGCLTELKYCKGIPSTWINMPYKELQCLSQNQGATFNLFLWRKSFLFCQLSTASLEQRLSLTTVGGLGLWSGFRLINNFNPSNYERAKDHLPISPTGTGKNEPQVFLPVTWHVSFWPM